MDVSSAMFSLLRYIHNFSQILLIIIEILIFLVTNIYYFFIHDFVLLAFSYSNMIWIKLMHNYYLLLIFSSLKNSLVCCYQMWFEFKDSYNFQCLGSKVRNFLILIYSSSIEDVVLWIDKVWIDFEGSYYFRMVCTRISCFLDSVFKSSIKDFVELIEEKWNEFSESPIFREYWWACLLSGIGFIVFMAIFIKCCAVHTPSSNPKKPPARRLSETLRRPMNTLRRMRHPGRSGTRAGPSRGPPHGYGEGRGRYYPPKASAPPASRSDLYAGAYSDRGSAIPMRQHKV